MVNGWLFKGSHAHSCPGAFSDGTGAHFLLLQNPANGSLGPWFPNTNAGPPTEVGPLVSATGGSDLWVGGDFTKVNGVGQQGLTRFTNLGPGAAPLGPVLPTLVQYDGRPGEGHRPDLVGQRRHHPHLPLAARREQHGRRHHHGQLHLLEPAEHHPHRPTAPSGTSQMYRIEVYDGQNPVRGGYSTITVK